MKYASTLLALFAIGSTACTTSKEITPDDPHSARVPQPGDDRPRAPGAVTAPGLALGAACESTDVVHCGTKGRVAVEMEMSSGGPLPRKRAVPCAMQPLSPPNDSDRQTGCVKDDRVYLSGDCRICRQSSQWDLTGAVAEMTDAQLVQAQERVSLAPGLILRTPDAWQSAIAAAAAKSKARPN